MPAKFLAALAIGPVLAVAQADFRAPVYTAGSIANSASNEAGPYAANSFLSIYGVDLSYVTKALAPGDILNGMLPTVLSGARVQVLLNQIPANLYYVSPGQVNALVPPNFGPGQLSVRIVREGVAGPLVTIPLTVTAPAIFELENKFVIATHLDFSVIRGTAPARPGEVIVLWATGLGATTPLARANQLAPGAAPLADLAAFRVWINDVPVDPRNVFYAGAAPGFAGLFQINVRLPDDTPQDPEVRIGFPDSRSPAGRKVFVR